MQFIVVSLDMHFGHAYSMIASAPASRSFDTASPSAVAVFRLLTISMRVGCNTGNSEGLAPLNILLT